jgi:hypothetical protein
MARFHDRSELQGFQPKRKGGIIRYTDGSKTNEDTGAGVYGYGTRKKLSFSPEQYTTLFQARSACHQGMCSNLDRGYRNRNIYILSPSKVAIKVLDNYQINSELVWSCHQSHVKLAGHKRVQLI